MAIIYHITTRQEWEAAQALRSYKATSLHTEGFIHCSEHQQVDGVLRRYFKEQRDLLLLMIDTDKLTSELKYEMAPVINEMFPHVYGPINFDAVIEIRPVNPEMKLDEF
jgi:uncharacterized protein (DUF952 family)